MFGEAVTEYLKRWDSLRACQYATGIDYSVINRMKNGIPPKTETLVQFAVAAAPKGKEVDYALRLLKLAGLDSVVELMETAQRVAVENALAGTHTGINGVTGGVAVEK